MSYEQILRVHLLPQFGQMRLDQISRDKIKSYVSKLAASGGFGRGTLKNILATVRAVLGCAVEDGFIATNPAFRLGKFTLQGARKRSPEFLTRIEAQRFLEAARTLRPKRYPLFLTGLRAGLRLGELLALHWDDIQFGESENDTNRFILVRHNFTRKQFTDPKSRKERRVDLSRELRHVLKNLRDQRVLQAVEHGNFDERGQPKIPTLVFPSDVGRPLNGSNLYNRDFLPCLEAAGLRRVTLHALRHTFASLLIQGGASLAYVKEQMGHSSIQVTVDIYGHLIPSGNIDWVDGLDTQTSPQVSASPAQVDSESETKDWPQTIEMIGGPTRTRTWDQRIMSPLL